MSAADTAGVVAPPPLIALATLALGLALDRYAPLGAAAAIAPNLLVRIIAAGVIAAAGAWIGVRALLDFRRIGTSPEPWKPTTALATGGIYGKTRNPMYQGLGLLLIAAAIGFASDWTFLLLAPAALVLHFGVVRREEAYLERKFGDDYRSLVRQVPRYGWPF